MKAPGLPHSFVVVQGCFFIWDRIALHCCPRVLSPLEDTFIVMRGCVFLYSPDPWCRFLGGRHFWCKGRCISLWADGHVFLPMYSLCKDFDLIGAHRSSCQWPHWVKNWSRHSIAGEQSSKNNKRAVIWSRDLNNSSIPELFFPAVHVWCPFCLCTHKIPSSGPTFTVLTMQCHQACSWGCYHWILGSQSYHGISCGQCLRRGMGRAVL